MCVFDFVLIKPCRVHQRFAAIAESVNIGDCAKSRLCPDLLMIDCAGFHKLCQDTFHQIRHVEQEAFRAA